MKWLRCEDGLYSRARCKKRAIQAIQFRVEFGRRVCMNGPDEVVYTSRVTVRCAGHSAVPNEEGRLEIAAWIARLAVA